MYTTKNEIAIEFYSKKHKKGSFSSFSDDEINLKKEIVINDFLNNEKKFSNNHKILSHWEKMLLQKLKKQLLNLLLNK